ncbi:MAG: glycerate kinase [Muribaculaceae bacterium]|nr:glycerate kinase [Muribaculaceae bacterium]
MKILVAIDSFKGCLSSAEAGRAVELGIREAIPDAQVLTVPVSDGGEGMLEAFTAALGGTIVTTQVHDPLMRPVEARYGLSPDGSTAIIEMAQASGLTRVAPAERDAWRATTRGTGELIAHALRRGCTHILMGLGGSATTDGGRGMLEALGIRFEGDTVDLSQSMLAGRNLHVTVASDVQNPLCGTNGAAHVYGPQKGATPTMVERLDQRLRQFADLTARALGTDYRDTPGAGAAGGMGFALLAYMNAELRSGIDLLTDLLDFDCLLQGATCVITGEGSADRQTLMGKLPQGILNHAQGHGVPTILLAGRVADREALLHAGFAAVECINPADSPLAECMHPAVARQRVSATISRLFTTHL